MSSIGRNIAAILDAFFAYIKVPPLLTKASGAAATAPAKAADTTAAKPAKPADAATVPAAAADTAVIAEAATAKPASAAATTTAVVNDINDAVPPIVFKVALSAYIAFYTKAEAKAKEEEEEGEEEEDKEVVEEEEDIGGRGKEDKAKL
ncbi:hypothetical protein P8C59_005588 [Phyllachora maydis]|uniref:Uncharacterized protein n=1 Tax=Phyllachora maydis TaxID=1825666 RepID=A0AAD9I5U4_9PEZI|nr:hypothetical protein P8C59_005588 [Phyllachora maydis]